MRTLHENPPGAKEAMMAYVECIEACADVILRCQDEDVLRDVEMRLATLCGLIGVERTCLLDPERESRVGLEYPNDLFNRDLAQPF